MPYARKTWVKEININNFFTVVSHFDMFSFIDSVVDIQPSLTTVSLEDKKNEYKALMEFLRLGDPLLQELANPSSPPPTPAQDNDESANRGPQQSDDVSADSGAANNANMKTWLLITLGILFHIW